MKSDCKDASELTFEKIKSSTVFVCAKKNMDGNILAVTLIMQSIYVHFYGETVEPVDVYHIEIYPDI